MSENEPVFAVRARPAYVVDIEAPRDTLDAKAAGIKGMAVLRGPEIHAPADAARYGGGPDGRKYREIQLQMPKNGDALSILVLHHSISLDARDLCTVIASVVERRFDGVWARLDENVPGKASFFRECDEHKILEIVE